MCIRDRGHGSIILSGQTSRQVLAEFIVTHRCCVKKPEFGITQTTPHDSPEALVFYCQRSRQNSNVITPYGGAKRNFQIHLNTLRWLPVNIVQHTCTCTIGCMLWTSRYVAYRCRYEIPYLRRCYNFPFRSHFLMCDRLYSRLAIV